MVDLRRLRLSNITSPEYSHLLLALYWPVYGAAFALLEKLRPVEQCHAVWCPLDDLVPFNEWFFLPYLFWFVFIIGIHLYLALMDPKGFRRLMYFIMTTYTFTVLVYLVWPTCQNLRPENFARDNLLTRFAAAFYAFDTNTNVCPSLHVIGSFAAAFAAWDTERFRSFLWRTAFFAAAVLISVSTLFVKQHSVIDAAAGCAVSIAGYFAVYVLPDKIKKGKKIPDGAAK